MVLIALSSFSCDESVELSNPFDTNVSLSSPKDLQILSMTENSLSLSWTTDFKIVGAEQSKAAYINVEHSLDGINFSVLDSLSASNLSGTIKKPFLTNMEHYFRIQARVGARTTAYSSVVSKKNDFLAPSNLTITSMNTNSVLLNWTDNSSFETGFVIEMGRDSVIFDSIMIVSPNITTASVTGTYDSTTIYYFRVYADGLYNKSPLSNTVNQDIKGNIITPTGIEMIYVEGGTFLMGAPDSVGNPDEHPQHSVQLNNYYIGKYEITYGLVKKVVAYVLARGGWLDNPYAYGGNNNNPMTNTSWDWVQTFISYLNAMESTHNYRLPTEAEWEYAARGGNKSRGYIYSGSNNEDEVAWVKSGYGPSIVGTKKPNELGIYDMTGNVLEWCNDYYGPYSAQAQMNPVGPSTGALRIVRGGSWSDANCRTTLRYDLSDYLYQIYQKGFRIVREK